MNKPTNYTHYRYKTILPQSVNSHHKSHWSCNLKDVSVLTSSKYKNIRQLRRDQELKNSYTQRRLGPTPSILKSKTSRCPGSKELIDVAKVKLYQNINKIQDNQQCTMNRNNFKHFIKTKKQTEFSMTKSVEEIEKKYPKKIDVFINELKLKVAALEEQSRISASNRAQKDDGPLTMLKNHRIMVRQLLPKSGQKGSVGKAQERGRVVTEYEGEVSGWQIEPMKQVLVQSNYLLEGGR